MRITDTHKEYNEFIEKWTRYRDAIEGEDAIKAKETAYLPALSGQRTEEYDSYVMRALWFNASGRTAEGLTGLIMRRPPIIDGVDKEDEMLKDFDMQGTPFNSFVSNVVDEVVGIGRVGILVDYPSAEEGQTIAEAEAMGVRPYASMYKAEDIINWQLGRINNRVKLIRIVLREVYLPDETKYQYRELTLDEGVLRIDLWVPNPDANNRDPDAQFVIDSTVYPKQNHEAMDCIPFWFAAPKFSSYSPQKSPIHDVISVNISHYRTSADLEHARFFLGHPTPVLAGFGFTDDQTISLGTEHALLASDGTAKWGFLEFTGQGLTALENAISQKESMMARLGARMLQTEKKEAETAEALTLKAAGESSVLATIANNVSIVLTEVLQEMVEWSTSQESDDIKVVLNTDYIPKDLSAQDLLALMQLMQSGSIAKFDFFKLLKQGNILAEDRNYRDFDIETSSVDFNKIITSTKANFKADNSAGVPIT